MLTPTTFSSYTGGITDFPENSRPDQYQFADNCLIRKSGKRLFSRPGSRPWDTVNCQLPTGNYRVGFLGSFGEDQALIASARNRCFRYSAGWQELLGPTGNPFFSAGDYQNRVSGSSWRGHLILTNDGGARPMKIYQDAGGTFRAVTLGLPAYLPGNSWPLTQGGGTVPAAMATLANDLNTKFSAHYADGALHTTAADAASQAILTTYCSTPLAAGNSFAVAQAFIGGLMKAYMHHYQDAVAPGTIIGGAVGQRLYHQNLYNFSGVVGQPNIALSSTILPTTWLELAAIVNELKLKYNWHVRAFATHPSVGTVSAVADIANTVQGPAIAEQLPKYVLDLANEIKAAFNAHAAYVGYFTAAGDSLITVADATDQNTLAELAAHIYARYQFHQADLAAKVYVVYGQCDSTHQDGIYNVSVTVATALGIVLDHGYIDLAADPALFNGSLLHAYIGMALSATIPAGSLHANINSNTRVGTMLPNTPGIAIGDIKFELGQINSGAPAAPASGVYAISHKMFHTPKTNASTALSASTPADMNFDQLVKRNDTLYAALLSIATCLNAHVGDTSGHDFLTAWAPIQSAVNVSKYPVGSFKQYEYGFCFARSYQTSGGPTFKNRSKPFYKSFVVSREEDISNLSISGLSQITNTGSQNYDLAGSVLEIYRSINGGQVLYKVGEVANATTSFVDNVSDTDLIQNEQLYTTGGVLSSDAPPICAGLHITQAGIPLFWNVTSTLDDGSTEVVPNRILIGVQDAPDWVPSGNFVDLPSTAMGVSSVRTLPIAFTQNSCHRLEGSFDSQGQGSVNSVTISDRIGLVASNSLVQVDGAVIFAGPDQFYMTDGYTVAPLGRAWPTTYANVTSGTRAYNLQGSFDKSTNRTWFAATGAGTENDRCFIWDMNFPVDSSSGGCFTTASNGSYFAPSAICFYQGNLIRGDSRGYVFQHLDTLTSDPRLDLTGANTSASTWATRWVPYNFLSSATNFGMEGFRKWSSVVETKFTNLGDLSAQLTGIQDLGRTTGACYPIRARHALGVINERRYFPAGSLFCSRKQFQLTLAKVTLCGSSMDGITLGLATVDAAAKTLTLAAGSYPLDLIDQAVSFVADGYTAEWTVSAQTGGVLTLLDPGNTLVSGATKWLARGYPKTETMELQEFTLWATQMGVNQTTASGEAGTNA